MKRKSSDIKTSGILTNRSGPIDRPLTWAAGVFTIHLLGLALLFDPLQGLINSAPLLDQDWGLHFHHLSSTVAFWQQDKGLWGYNPFFMAGYPSNTIQDLSIKLLEIAALGFSTVALTPVQWFKLLAFFTAASVPWLMYFTSRNLFAGENSRKIAAAAAFLGTAYWWNSLPREMFFYGMVGYPIASYLAVLGVSLFYRMALQPLAWSSVHIGWIFFALTVPALHVQSLVIFLPPMLAFLIARPELLRSKLVFWLFGSAALSLAANLIWLVPAFDHREYDNASQLVEELSLFISVDPWTFLKDYLGPQGYWSFRPLFWEKGLRLMLLALGFMGILKLLRGEHKGLGTAWLTGLISLFLIAYFGSLIPGVKGWQPLRFKIPFDLFCILAAVYFLEAWLARRLLASSSKMVQTLLLCGTVAFLINLLTTESLGKMKLRTQTHPTINAIVDWIRSETPSEARVLFEESGDETGFVYDGMYLSSFVPHWTGRQLIGGPINLYNDRHHFAEFHSGKLFKKDIQTLSDDEIGNYFALYNVGAVVAFHPRSVRRLQSIPGLVVLDSTVGPIHLMRVNQPLTWFLKGEGKLMARFNRIEVSDVKGKELILKYHWLKGLVSKPTLRILPITVADDPIPFIRIVDPPPAFVLKTAR